MKIYLLVDKAKSGKTTTLKELGYTFCPDNGGIFSPLINLIYEGKKKIAIDDYTGKGNVLEILKMMKKGDKLIYNKKYENPKIIEAEIYKDVEIVLSTDPVLLRLLNKWLLDIGEKVNVEEFKKNTN